jgi:N-acetylmuramoyl-L-alanine amidase
MHWTSGFLVAGISSTFRKSVRPIRSLPIAAIALIASFFLSSFLSSAAPEKHLSVYSVAANYSLPLVQRDGRGYVGLLELLEPLGKVSSKSDGSHWRLRYNNIEGDFQSGKTRARVQGRDADLIARFILENGRGLVPLVSLNSLLPRFLGGPVTLHEEAGRLFIGSVGTHFTAALATDDPSRLIFHFTSPVRPSISNESGVVRMTFSHEPVVAPASPTLTFGSKTISSAVYSEANGSAIIAVNSTAPATASIGGDGRTITVSLSSATAQNTAPSTTTAPNGSIPAQQNNTTPATTPVPAVARRYFVVVDASHGGDDHGESLSSTLLEKDITISLARSLRQELESRGVQTLVLRDSDANLSLDQRAFLANTNRATIYIALHAASSGRGVRVYTALLPYGEDDRGPFRSWTISQRSSLPLSQSAASSIAVELQKRQIPVRTLAAPLRPLNNVTCAALAVEVAPQGSDVMQLTAPDYQQLVTSAVATAIAAARPQLGATP